MLTSSVLGGGDAGAIDLTANDILVDGLGSDQQTLIAGITGPESTGNGADLSLKADNIAVINNGNISVDAVDGAGSAGNINIEAETLTIDGGATSSRLTAITASSSGTGQAGTIDIKAGSLNVLRIGSIQVSGTSTGEPGQIRISADRVTVDGRGRTDRQTTIFSAGTAQSDAGDISIDTGELTVVDGGTINGITSGSGDGGSTEIKADTIVIDGRDNTLFTGITNSTIREATGNAGSVTITADNLEILNDGQIASDTVGSGDGGTITVDANRLVIESDPDSETITGINSDTSGTGAAGTVRVTSENLTILGGGAQISSSTSAPGNAGEIAVNATRIKIDGRNESGFVGITSQGTPGSAGNAGTIQVIAGDFVLRNGAELSSTAFGIGTGGDVVVKAEEILIEGSGAELEVTGITAAASPVGQQGDGDAGTIRIDAGTLTMSGDDAEIQSTNDGRGDSGNILINLTDSLVLDDDADITTAAVSGGGGKISIDAGQLVSLSPGSTVVTSVAQDVGNAGDIDIRTSLLSINDGRIVAQADAGQGGDIQIRVDDIVRTPNALINADAGATGVDGTIQVTAPDVDLSGGLVVLEEGELDAASLLRARCAAQDDSHESSFTATGKGGLAPTPDDHLRSSLAPETMTLAMTAEGDLIAVPANFDRTACRGAL